MLISGQGGTVTLRVVVPPLPSGSGTAIGGIVTLGCGMNPPVVILDVMLTLEYGIPLITIEGMTIVTVVIVVKYVIVT